MSKKGLSKYSATDSSVGYLYQVLSALLYALRRLKSGQDFLVGIECLDDIDFETTGGEPTDLLQTKHHRKGIGALTDASTDLWRTLRIWFEGSASGEIPSTANLYLITTGTAPSGSAASYLRVVQRDILAAQKALDAVVSSSTNQDNKAAYDEYSKATPSKRAAILEKLYIIDAAPRIEDIDEELLREVYWAASRENLPVFIEHLVGWWLRRVLRQLANPDTGRIGSVELELQMSDLREQFKLESLPIDEDLLEFTLDDATKTAHEDSIFVRQLELIKAGKRRIASAIRDYYRAYEQRSRWLRDDLVVDMDLHKYENTLIEEWELVFEAMRDELGDAAADAAKESAARNILTWAEHTIIPIRPNVTTPFVSRGSFHMLSDEVRVGWHPEFQERLSALLGAKESVA